MKLHTAGLLLIENRKLLLAWSRNKNCFYLPGGKLAAGETAPEALCREIAEELNIIIDENSLNYHGHITAEAYGEEANTIMEQDCFFLYQSVTPQASAEIGELKYFSLNEYLDEANRAPGAVMILERLKNEGYID
jgi:8-oxo-dGTP pyrophosphatase MutT (NUDIX family)